MEALTRLVTDSMVRHGFDRPIDPRRLQWSRWFRCDSPHSLLVVPSKPGIFAIAEEIADFGLTRIERTHVGAAALGCPAEQSSATASSSTTSAAAEVSTILYAETLGGDSIPRIDGALAPEGMHARRMLAVLQFSEDDDMAFTLDRMFTRINPMRARLSSGRCFVRFVVIQDQDQRRNICSALNQWMLSSAEKASGIPAGFSSSLELTSVARMPSPASAVVDSDAHKNLHCPHPLPCGF
jgi:hypothetical protein